MFTPTHTSTNGTKEFNQNGNTQQTKKKQPVGILKTSDATKSSNDNWKESSPSVASTNGSHKGNANLNEDSEPKRLNTRSKVLFSSDDELDMLANMAAVFNKVTPKSNDNVKVDQSTGVTNTPTNENDSNRVVACDTFATHHQSQSEHINHSISPDESDSTLGIRNKSDDGASDRNGNVNSDIVENGESKTHYVNVDIHSTDNEQMIAAGNELRNARKMIPHEASNKKQQVFLEKAEKAGKSQSDYCQEVDDGDTLSIPIFATCGIRKKPCDSLNVDATMLHKSPSVISISAELSKALENCDSSKAFDEVARMKIPDKDPTLALAIENKCW